MALKHIVYAECRVYRRPFYLIVDAETGMVEDVVGYQRAFELLNQPAESRTGGGNRALPGAGAGAGGRGALPGAQRSDYAGGYTYTRGQYAIEPYGGRGGLPAEQDEYNAPGADEVVIRGVVHYRCPYCGSSRVGGHRVCGIVHCTPEEGKDCICPGCGEHHWHEEGDVYAAGSRYEEAPRGLATPPGGGGQGLPRGRRGNPDTPALPY